MVAFRTLFSSAVKKNKKEEEEEVMQCESRVVVWVTLFLSPVLFVFYRLFGNHRIEFI